ncbi:MAG: transposase [Alphaproteobacteria bacterium]|nr:transposase [Alphaproteobacteria bacterium]
MDLSTGFSDSAGSLCRCFRLHDECLNEHLFNSLGDARRIIEAWRIDYNTTRIHTARGGLAPLTYAAHHRRHRSVSLERRGGSARRALTSNQPPERKANRLSE